MGLLFLSLWRIDDSNIFCFVKDFLGMYWWDDCVIFVLLEIFVGFLGLFGGGVLWLVVVFWEMVIVVWMFDLRIRIVWISLISLIWKVCVCDWLIFEFMCKWLDVRVGEVVLLEVFIFVCLYSVERR